MTVRTHITVPSMDMVPVVIRQQQAKVEQYVRGMSYEKILRDQLPWLERKHADYFGHGVDPVGRLWPVLAPSTIRKKGKDDILIDTSRLMASLTGQSPDAVREVTDKSLTFGTRVPYSRYHQQGSNKWKQAQRIADLKRRLRKKPAAKAKAGSISAMLGLVLTSLGSLFRKETSKKRVKKGPKVNRRKVRKASPHKGLPPRPHVGLSRASANELSRRVANAIVESIT